MTASQLSADLIHEILVRSPDYGTLSAAIRISQRYHEVFKAHPKSILRRVTGNVTGPAMAQAARLAHHKVGIRDDGEDFDDNQRQSNACVDVDGLPDEDYYFTADLTVTRGISTCLQQHAEVMKVLRDFYSLRNKDRTSLSSKLEQDEILRFDRAMYRFWLFFEMWLAQDEDEDEDDDGDNNEDEDPQERQGARTRAKFKRLMAPWSSEELFEMINVSRFYDQTTQWQLTMSSVTDHSNPSATLDPIVLAKSVELGTPVRSRAYHMSWRPFCGIISETLLSRKVKKEDMEAKIANAIVKTIVGAQDICSRCYSVTGLNLLGASNMSLLAGLLTPRNRAVLLPGLLSQNHTEFYALIAHLQETYGPTSERDLFHELVAVVPDSDGDAALEQHQWSKDGWYCLVCMRDLYRQRLMVWWRNTKAKKGAPRQDDCWYGYNCRTMRHRSSHASKLNHLCTPTRGEAPAVPPAGQPAQVQPIAAPDNPN